MALKTIYQGPNGAVAIDEQQNTTVSADYNAVFSDYIITATGAGNFTITLPPANPSNGKNVVVKCLTTNPITVSAQSGEFIDTVPSKALLNGEVLEVLSDGTKWINTAGDAISGSKIINGTVTGDKLAANSVTADKLATNSVTADKIANNTITGAKLAADSVTADKIATGAVGTTEISTSAEPTVSTIYSNSWFRSNGNSGWYNQTYGGGIFMESSDVIKTYGGKNFYCSGQISAGSFWGSYYGTMYPSTIRFYPDNPGSGTGDTAIMSWGQKSSFTENCRLTIEVQNDPTDDVLITTNQGYIQVGGTDYDAGINIKASSQIILWYPNRRFVLQSDGNAVIYNQFGTAVWASGTAGSDLKLKENIKTYTELSVEKIKKLRVIEFNYIENYDNSMETKVGFIAQDVEKIIPQAVKSIGQNQEKTLLLHKEEIVPYLVKAVQEQQTQIEALEERIKKLEELIKY
jgi:hypothetical protein